MTAGQPLGYEPQPAADRVCKPYDKATNSSGWCFSSLLCQVLGVKFDEQCLRCFAAHGYTVDNDARPESRSS